MNKISIITATVEGGPTLGMTLDSVADNKYPRLEHIVVDGSYGAADKVLANYPNVIQLSRERHGVYDAINFGMHHATGDIIGIVHGGDMLYEDDVLRVVSRVFEENPEVDFIYGDLRYLNTGTFKEGRIYHSARFKPWMIKYGFVPPHCTLFIRRHVMERVGDYTTEYPIGGDFDMWIRLFSDNSLKGRYINKILIAMSDGGSSTTIRSRLYQNHVDKLRALKAHGLPANPLRFLMKYVWVAEDLISDFLFGYGKY